MEAFHQEYPGVHFQILNHSTQDSIQAVRDGKVDFAVVSSLPLHISEPLRMKKLHTYRDILISGRRFEELKDRPVSLRELASYPWISLTSESISRTFLNTYFAQYGLSFSPDMELATTDLILPLCATTSASDSSRKPSPTANSPPETSSRSRLKSSFRNAISC